MAKNYASNYASTNDSMAIEQRFYVKEETTRGTLQAPTGSDFIFHRNGASFTSAQPIENSETKSGRNMVDFIKGKKTFEWSMPVYLNIDTAVAAGATECDPAVQTLWKSMMGVKTISSGVLFDNSSAPDITFTMLQCGDRWAEQARGCFCQTAEIALPGDGQAGVTFGGAGITALKVGIGKSTINNNANTVTLQIGEGKLFPVGALVMLVEANGTTRSADTPDGSPRTVTDVTGDVVTVSGAVLADADGSSTPVYLCYYEPTTPVAINEPQTGLVGSVTIDTLPSISCLRNATISLNNNHELVDYCFGADSLSGSIFVPGGRFEATLSMELNLNKNLLSFINSLSEFPANEIALVVGDSGDRHFKVELAKVIFQVPAIEVPETGSIPVTFDGGMCLDTAVGQSDAVVVKYL